MSILSQFKKQTFLYTSKFSPCSHKMLQDKFCIPTLKTMNSINTVFWLDSFYSMGKKIILWHFIMVKPGMRFSRFFEKGLLVCQLYYIFSIAWLISINRKVYVFKYSDLNLFENIVFLSIIFNQIQGTTLYMQFHRVRIKVLFLLIDILSLLQGV